MDKLIWQVNKLISFGDDKIKENKIAMKFLNNFLKDKTNIYCCVTYKDKRLKYDLDNALLYNFHIGKKATKKCEYLFLEAKEGETNSYTYCCCDENDKHETTKNSLVSIKLEDFSPSKCAASFNKKMTENFKKTLYYYCASRKEIDKADRLDHEDISKTTFGLNIIVPKKTEIYEDGFLKQLIDGFTSALQRPKKIDGDKKGITKCFNRIVKESKNWLFDDKKSPVLKESQSFNPKDYIYYQIVVKKRNDDCEQISICLYKIKTCQ